ncbi:conserved hypothetical protein [gamma proteobacterium HTCC5015]|nr:conserved hypothetical protein [gamma proteobacterium HTCC5015]
MIKGLAITPPILGRIAIGRVVEKNGKRLPEKDDQFTITTQVQSREGWILHPLDEELRQKAEKGKIRSIPVKLLFSEPELNLRAEYSLFDRQTGRPVCAGDGNECRRRTAGGLEKLPCPSPEGCDIGGNGFCKPYGRLHVVIGDDHSLGSFVFRTTGYNSIRTLMARMSYLQAASGNLLPFLPLELKLRGKSTTMSHGTPIYYVVLGIREGYTLAEAIREALSTRAELEAAGYNQSALDQAAINGFTNAVFEVDEEEGSGVIEEFYPTDSSPSPQAMNDGLKGKLGEKQAQKM